MDSFDSVLTPPTSISNTHVIKDETFFIKSSGFAPRGVLSFNSGTRTLAKDEELIVLEHGIGYEGKWARVNYKGEAGFILVDSLAPLKNIKPFCEINNSFLPNEFSFKGDWKDRKMNDVYYDEYTGKVSIHLELPYETVNGREDLLEKMKEALYFGTVQILKESGKLYSDNYVKNLLNKYYIFAQAEEYFFPDRPCSTLRVLVTIPKRFLENGSIAKNPNDVLIDAFNSDGTFGDFLDKTLSNIRNPTNSTNPESTEEEPKYKIYTFNNYGEFEDLFTGIASYIGQANVSYLAGVNGWYLEPQVALDFPSELVALNNFYSLTNKLLADNLPSNSLKGTDNLSIVAEVSEDPNSLATRTFQTFENVGRNIGSGVSNFFGFATMPIPEYIWYGKLTLVIENKNLILKHISFVDEKGIKIPMNVGIITYLNNDAVLNKTTINYIKKFFYDKPKTLEERFSQTTNELRSTFEESQWPNGEQLTAAAKNTPDLTGSGAQNIKQTTDYAQKVAKEGLTIVNKSADIIEQAVAIFSPENFLQEFLKNRHYPVVSVARMNPIDLQDCVVDNYDRVTKLYKQKFPTEKEKAIKLWNKTKQLRDAKKTEGSAWDRAVTDFKGIRDPNLRILFGIDQTPPIDPNDDFVVRSRKKFSKFAAAANLVDWSRILAEAIKCSAVELDPELMQQLLSLYQKGRKIVDTIALATVCNPYLTQILKKLLQLELPIIPNVDPTKSLSDVIARQILKILNDALVLAIRQALTGSLKACIGNPKASSDLTNPDGLKNSIDVGAGNNDPNINDMLNDLFAGNNGILDQDGNIDPNKKAQAIDIVKNLLDDILACLTPLELCKLLLGNSVSQDVYDVILSIVRRKYSTPNDVIDISSRLNSTDAVIEFFRKIGLGMALDLTICTPILENAPQNNNLLQFCDGNYVEQLRRNILLDKGLTDDLIDDLLNKARDQKKNDIENILKILESDEPFKDVKVPSALCSIGPNGETIPPDINLSPSLEDFGELINNMLEEVYTTFDQEASEWYKTTFTPISAINNNLLYFDRESGQVKTRELNTETLKNLIGDKYSSGDALSGNLSPTDISASYIFSDILNNKKINTAFDNSKYNLNVLINGYEQQKLDQNIINDELRHNVGVAENSLKLFLGQFMTQFTTFFAYTVFDLIQNQPLVSNLGPNMAWYEKVAGFLGNLTSSQLIQLIKTFDLFARNNIADSKDLEKAKEILGLNTADDATAFLASDIGATSYLTTMNYIIQNKQALTNIIDKIYSINFTNNVQVYLFGPNSINTNTGNVEGKANLILKLNNCIKNYELVKNYYSTVLGVKINYPDFAIDFNTGVKEIKVNDYVTFTNYFNNEFYDLYDVNITKNQTNYIKLRNGQKVSKQIKDYIVDELKIDLRNTDKKSILNAFLNIKRNNYPDKLIVEEINDISEQDAYNLCNKLIINGIQKNVSPVNNIFLQTYKNSSAPPPPPPDASDEEKEKNLQALQNVKQVYTRSVQLLTPVTPQQKSCGKRPHLLDIDQIKEKMLEDKKNSFCLDLIKEEKILNDEDINSSELESLQIGDTQAILQNGNYALLLRLCLHDVLLRGIGVFGRYDPQSLRNSEIFVQFMADLVESEIRGADTIVFNMMLNHFYNLFVFKNPNLNIAENRKNLIKRDLYIDFIRNELKTNVLAKLAKRLNEDTNRNLISIFITKGGVPNILKIKNILNDYNNISGLLNITNDSVYIKVNSTTDRSEYQKIYSSSGISIDSTIKEFRNSKEFKLLFEYIFNLEHALSFVFMTNVLCTSTRRQIVSGFRDTKKALFRTIKNIQANGQEILTDNNNLQDVLNSDEIDSWAKFIQKMIIESTLEVVKGFVETTDFNIALSSSTYKIIKSLAALNPDPNNQVKVSSVLIPAMSIPLAIPIPPAPLGIVPWTSIPLAIIYFVLGLWYEDDKEDKDKTQKDFLAIAFNNFSNRDINCDTLSGGEIISKDETGYYVGIK